MGAAFFRQTCLATGWRPHVGPLHETGGQDMAIGYVGGMPPFHAFIRDCHAAPISLSDGRGNAMGLPALVGLPAFSLLLL